jgi:peroxiredoxin
MNSLLQSRPNLFAISILLIAAGWIGFSAFLPGIEPESDVTAPRTGFRAPDFTLQTLDNEEVTLSELQGQVVLVNLWASWCGPCRAEMPAMERIYQEYKDQGFTIAAVNITSQDSIGGAQNFVDQYGLTFPILLDVNGEVARLYNLNAFPSSYFIDRFGVVQEVVFGGPMAEALLRTRVESLLGVR